MPKQMPQKTPVNGQTVVVLVSDIMNGDYFAPAIPATALRLYKDCIRAKFTWNGKDDFYFFAIPAGSDGCHHGARVAANAYRDYSCLLFDTAAQAEAYMAERRPQLWNPTTELWKAPALA